MHVRISCKFSLEKCRCRHFHRLQNADGKFLAQGLGVTFSVGAFANPKNRVHSKRLLTFIVKKAKNLEERQKDRKTEKEKLLKGKDGEYKSHQEACQAMEATGLCFNSNDVCHLCAIHACLHISR